MQTANWLSISGLLIVVVTFIAGRRDQRFSLKQAEIDRLSSKVTELEREIEHLEDRRREDQERFDAERENWTAERMGYLQAFAGRRNIDGFRKAA